MTATIDDTERFKVREQAWRGSEVGFHGEACGPLTRAKRLDLTIAEQIEQLKAVGETHVPHIIASLAQFL
jgi:hypothetical protein